MAEIDRSTIQALRQGEERAFAAVVNELHGPVYRFLLRLSGNSARAEDLTQETFLAVWQGIGSFMHKSRFKTWVFAIAYRQFLRYRDKRAVETVDLGETGLSNLPDRSDLCARVVETDEREHIRRVVYSLPPRYREVVVLVHLDGLAYGEAAEVLGVPVGTIKSRMNGAFKLLREKLRGTEVQGDEVRKPESLSGQSTEIS